MAQQARRLNGDSITVDFETERSRTLLELDSDEDRAFSVGASAHADVRISGPGVPAVAYYIERRAAEIWLVPAYGRRVLLVNGIAVSTPRRLARRAVVEVAGVQALLDIGIRRSGCDSNEDDRADDSDEIKTELSAATRRSHLAYLEGLPGADDRTLIDHRVHDTARSPGSASRAWPDGQLDDERPRQSSLRPAPRRAPPHLWTLLALRPFEAAAFVLLVGLLILVVELVTALVLRG